MCQVMQRTGENTKAGAAIWGVERYLELLDALDYAGIALDVSEEVWRRNVDYVVF